MPPDDRDPYWAARFRMSAGDLDALRRGAEQTVRDGYDAATRALARDGDVGRAPADPAPAVDKFKAGVQAEMANRMGQANAPSPSAPIAQPPSPKATARTYTKRDAARDFGAGVILDRLAAGEGADRASGYKTTFGNGRYDPPEWTKPVTEMTLDELATFQTGLAQRSRRSSASGRYQITRPTGLELRTRMGLTGAEKYDPDLQDRMGRERLRMAGYDAFLAGKIDASQLQNRLAGAWSSVANTKGGSSYGDPVGTTTEQIQAAIAQAKAEAEHLRELGFDPSSPAWR